MPTSASIRCACAAGADLINDTNRTQLGDDFTPVTRSAVSVALSRAHKADKRPSYPQEIPWSPIARTHQKDHLLTMLRTWARINHGDETVPEPARRRFENFCARLERDGLTLVEGLEALRLDLGEVDEQVVATLALDEAVTLVSVEPLNFTFSHAKPTLLPHNVRQNKTT